MNDSMSATIGTRDRLGKLIRASGDVIDLDDAVRVFDLSRSQASKLMSRWASQGWLRRVGPGRYVAVAVEDQASDLVVDDPWILVPALFAPCYIGGRTAAEHWDLTEQIFRDVVVLTTQNVRSRTVERQGAIFLLKVVQPETMFGTRTVWRGTTRVLISDVHRTMIDMLDDPALGGGIQHVDDCFRAYLSRKDRDFERLVRYADQLGNGAVFKRLGFLAERYESAEPLIEPCKGYLTKGNAKLDPALPCDRLVTRWRLFVPSSWIERRAL